MRYIITVAILALTMIACDGMQHDIEQYLDKGETIYVGKLDSIEVHPGKNRIMVEGKMPYGVTQTKCVFTWLTPSNQQESKEFDIVRKSPDDTFEFYIDELEEGQHDFEIITKDAKGNSSIIVKVGGYSYGDVYLSTLSNREIAKIEVVDDEARIKWLPMNNIQFFGCEVEYEKQDGSVAKVIAHNDASTTDLPGYKTDGNLKWRSFYLPDLFSIDTFYTPWDSFN